MADVSDDTFDIIRIAVREAARSAWSDLRDAHPDDAFYYFGLWTTPLAHSPVPTACSIEGLRRAVAEYRQRGVELLPDELRWSEVETPYDQYGSDHFFGVSRLCDQLGNPFERSPEIGRALHSSLVGALCDLDAEGFFGTGVAREAIVVNVSLPGHNTVDQLMRTASLMNPPRALIRYQQDWASR